MAEVHAAPSHKVRQPRQLLLLLLPLTIHTFHAQKCPAPLAPCSGVPVPCWCWIHDHR
jgi:hypothetical protein